MDRNLNPHKAARAAMWLYSKRYAAQGGGSIDFWESLTKQERRLCRRMVDDIDAAPIESPSCNGNTGTCLLNDTKTGCDCSS